MVSKNDPRILFVFSRRGSETSTRFGGFPLRIKKNGGLNYADYDCVALEDLIFRIYDDNKARVFDRERKIDVSKYSFVYFKSWQSMPEEAASLAYFLEGAGIPYADTQARHEYIAKTTNQMAMWSQGVSVPASIWGEPSSLRNYVACIKLDYPIIVKAVHGQKGRDNYLVNTKEEALEILDTVDKPMMIQEFIPNDGDYRVGVYGSVARWAIYRRSVGKSHLNNISAGGTAELVKVDDLPEGVAGIAEAAARSCDLEISGVDVVVHRDTKKLYVFEANQGSQIVTGAFSDSNMQAFDTGLKKMLSDRRVKARSRRKKIIGRTELVEIVHPLLEDTIPIVAKIDTGAYQSAIDAINIKESVSKDGLPLLNYEIINPTTGKSVRFETGDFGRVQIRSSLGHYDHRYIVPIEVAIKGATYSTRASLAKRTNQKMSMLLGRTLIAGNFVVDVEYSALEQGGER